MANPFKEWGTRLGPLPESAVKNQNKKSANNKNNKDQRKSLQKKLNALQSIDKPSGSDRAKILALKRRIKNLKNPKDAKTISQIQQESKQKMRSRAGDRNTDWKKMQKGDMKKEKFIKKYPESQTAKKANLKISKKKKNNKKMALGERWLKPLFEDI